MQPRGVENIEALAQTCGRIREALPASADAGWRRTLENVVNAVEELRGKFFLKTNPAVPVTRACLRDAEELEGILSRGEEAQVPEGLGRLRASTERLLKAADLDGMILT